MKQDDVADTPEKRAGEAVAKPPKKRRKYAPRPALAEVLATAARNIPEGKTSLEKLCGWLSPGDHKLSVTAVRIELMAKGFDLADGIAPLDAVPHVVDMLLKTLFTSTLDIKRDKARAAAAAADTAEIELEKLKGNLVSRDEVRRVMENAVVTFRGKIRFLDGLALEQKKAVCEQLANLRLEDDEAAG